MTKFVYGKTIDNHTRCTHYHSSTDVIAIKFKCCNKYYPCYQCHQEVANHPSQVWGIVDQNEKAVLCGMCNVELTIKQYMDSNNFCPNCKSPFNPNCANHYHLYFEKQ